MRYEGNIFRPPSEANSLIIQATRGCSYNKCTFCAMYQDVRFKIRPVDAIAEDIAMAREYLGPQVRRVFLADGDALIVKTERLLEIIDLLEASFPDLQRIGVYATPQALLIKSSDELEALRARKLRMLYLGVESGSETVLERLKKGVSCDQMITAGQRAVAAGMKLSTMIILGAGGPELSAEHARESGLLLSAINPRFISTLTMMVVPQAPIYEEARQEQYIPPTPRQTIEELRGLIAHLDVSGAIFRANHVSNLATPAGSLPKDKERMLAELDTVLAGAIPDEFGLRGF